MKSSVILSLALVVIIVIFTNCSILNKRKIKSEIKFSKRNVELIKECSKFAIEFTLDKSKQSFSASEVDDKKMRSKLTSLGASVTVSYKNAGHEISDSIVTFKTTSLFYGVHEIIYDFAYNQRKFEGSGSDTQTYYFVQVAERIYLRRRELPLM